MDELNYSFASFAKERERNINVLLATPRLVQNLSFIIYALGCRVCFHSIVWSRSLPCLFTRLRFGGISRDAGNIKGTSPHDSSRIAPDRARINVPSWKMTVRFLMTSPRAAMRSSLVSLVRFMKEIPSHLGSSRSMNGRNARQRRSVNYGE